MSDTPGVRWRLLCSSRPRGAWSILVFRRGGSIKFRSCDAFDRLLEREKRSVKDDRELDRVSRRPLGRRLPEDLLGPENRVRKDLACVSNE